MFSPDNLVHSKAVSDFLDEESPKYNAPAPSVPGPGQAAWSSSSASASDADQADPFRFTNGCSFAPSSETCTVEQSSLPKKITGEVPMSAFYEGGKVNQAKLRDYFKTLLTEHGIKYSKIKFWRFVAQLNGAISRQVGYENVTPADGVSEPRLDLHNFLNCYIQFSKGKAYFKDDQVRIKKYSCGKKYCLWCRDRGRQRFINQRMDIVKQAYGYGVEKLWRLQFTLPESLRDRALEEENLKQIRAGGKKIINHALGLKTRSNPGIDLIVHPVGDSDIMGNHVHLHAVVIPLTITKDKKTGEYKPKAINLDLLDNEKVKQDWNKLLREVFGADCDEATYPNIRYLPLYRIRRKNKKYKEDSGGRWGRVRRRLGYDYRSFAGDFQDKPVAEIQHQGESYLAVKGSTFEESYFGFDEHPEWRIVSVEQYAAQWRYLVDNNKITPYGFLKNLERYFKAGIFTREESAADNPEGWVEEDCVIWFRRGKEWCSNKQRVVKVNENWARLKNGVWLQIGVDCSWANFEDDEDGVNTCEAADPPPDMPG